MKLYLLAGYVFKLQKKTEFRDRRIHGNTLIPLHFLPFLNFYGKSKLLIRAYLSCVEPMFLSSFYESVFEKSLFEILGFNNKTNHKKNAFYVQQNRHLFLTLSL